MSGAKVRAACAGAAASGLLAAAPALPAAIEKAIPSTTRILFEEGLYGELGIAWFDPHQSGSGADLAPLGVPMMVPGSTGDVFEPQSALNGALRGDIGDRLSWALLLDQPYGADTRYGPGSFDPGIFTYDGTAADLDTWQVTGVVGWDVTPAVRVYAGARAERLSADASVPFLAGYDIDTDADWGAGWLVGAAFSRPEIALRVALTYSSAISHAMPTTEYSTPTGAVRSTTDLKTPQSVSLEAQTGVAPRTLVFGSIRWVDWPQFRVSPEVYETVVGMPLVAYTDPWWTYTLGVGRQISDRLAGALSVAWEPAVGGDLTTLGPYDGKTTLTAAMSYEIGRTSLTGGVSYGALGDTRNPLRTDFDEGSILGLGLTLGYAF